MPIKNLTLLSHQELKEVSAVLEHYSLAQGKRKFFRNTVGFVNKTFIIEIGDEKFVLRESSLATVPEHLELEIEVLRFLESENYKLSPRLLANKRGQYVTYHNDRFYMLQTFLSGEVKASWNDLVNFTPAMSENFFRESAKFTRAVHSFKPSKEYKNNPLIFYIRNGESMLKSFLKKIPPSEGATLLAAQEIPLIDFLKRTREDFESVQYDDLPRQLVHFDLHPGNVHFEGKKVVGLFDFDWVRFDCRISDIAATIGQSCYIYGGERTGLYVKEKITAGLKAYRAAYGQSEFTHAEENRLIRTALQGYMFFQLLWAMDWYRENFNTEGSLQVLTHFTNVCLINDYEKLFS